MTVKERREKVLEQMEPQSVLILYSGVELHQNADAYAPFEPNHNFFYLTGLRRENMILVMTKLQGEPKSFLFIEEADPLAVRWTGKRVSAEEAKEISQVDEVLYLASFEGRMDRLLGACPDHLYFDCNRCRGEDLPDYNLVKAREFAGKYPAMQLKDLFPIVAGLRSCKDEGEVALIKKAIGVTGKALENVMAHLAPGRMEYQAQADFEYTVQFLGADGVAFPTIAGSGPNGTMLHYGTNRDCCEDGSLLLLDLGARVDGYCADITRTYPVNGKFTDRQRRVYQAVLKANREIASMAKPGLTFRDLQARCSEILAQGCMELGLIKDPSEIGKYYMHGVSHPLGIDVHDVSGRDGSVLKPGMVITDEPGLYIDEWEIGIRIEDDLLITETGCEVLSEGVLRDPDEIEAFMGKDRNNL